MSTTADVATTIGDGLANFLPQILAVGGTVVPIAAGILALSVGWSFAKRFVKG